MNYEKLDQIKALIDKAEWFKSLGEGMLSEAGKAHCVENEIKTDALIRAWTEMEKFDPYKFVQDRTEVRPFNKDGNRDRNWDYVHVTDVWTLIERLQKRVM